MFLKGGRVRFSFTTRPALLKVRSDPTEVTGEQMCFVMHSIMGWKSSPVIENSRPLKNHGISLRWLLPSCLIALSLIMIIKNSFRKFQLEIGNSPRDITQLALKQRLKLILNCKDRPLQMERLQYSNYWLARNFIRGTISKNVGCAETITYTTNGEYRFFGSLAMLVARWLAPISFAVFAPGYDLNATMDSIQYVRNCLPESELIRQYVTFHIYFPRNHMPEYLPLNEEEAIRWQYDCYTNKIPYKNVESTEMFRTRNNLIYPINVGRNIARKEANTHFILASDIEIVPSPGLVQQFLEMVMSNQNVLLEDDKPRVFPLAIFELDVNASIPQSKTELEQMLLTKIARPFHWEICKICHLIPEYDEWVNAMAREELYVFSVTRREGEFQMWEPFYISDNKEPMFDERVTWEGQKNKRIQAFAMCLLGYEYHLLHSAFLVHSPGIKNYNKNSRRLKYFVPEMNDLIKYTIIPEYKILYGENKRCDT